MAVNLPHHGHIVESLYGPVSASAVTGCKDNMPEGVDPDNLFIIAGFTCYSCLGPLPESQCYFDSDEKEFCSCEDDSSCITWDAVPETIDLNDFIDWQFDP